MVCVVVVGKTVQTVKDLGALITARHEAGKVGGIGKVGASTPKSLNRHNPGVGELVDRSVVGPAWHRSQLDQLHPVTQTSFRK